MPFIFFQLSLSCTQGLLLCFNIFSNEFHLQNNNGRRWFKKVQQDWSILQNNLPGKKYFCISNHMLDERFWQSGPILATLGIKASKFLTGTIYVRVYEDRMDLLRAVIVGAYGTPYQDGLFFFDFHLPPEYPDVPPVRYPDVNI